METGSIADALVFAVSYINLRDGDDDDDDVKALESIASILNSATEEEKAVLAAAADKAGFSRWMEDMFGDEWTGNKRRA